MSRMVLRKCSIRAHAIGQWRMGFGLLNNKSGCRAKHTQYFPCTASSMKLNNVQQCSLLLFCEFSHKAKHDELTSGQKMKQKTKSIKVSSAKEFVVESDKTELSSIKANKLESKSANVIRNRDKDMLDRKFEVKRKGLKDVDEVADFVLKYFTKRNPIRKIFRIDTDEEESSIVDRKRVAMTLKQNFTLGCHEKSSGKLVAVMLGTVHDKRIDPISQIYDNLTSYAVLNKFLTWMKRDLYEALKTEKFLVFSITVVHPDYIGLGISLHLTSLLEDLAFENGCEYAVGLTVTRYMQIGSEQRSYSVLREVKFEDYVDSETNLKPDLDLSPIHTCAQLIFLKLKAKSRERKL